MPTIVDTLVEDVNIPVEYTNSSNSRLVRTLNSASFLISKYTKKTYQITASTPYSSIDNREYLAFKYYLQWDICMSGIEDRGSSAGLEIRDGHNTIRDESGGTQGGQAGHCESIYLRFTQVLATDEKSRIRFSPNNNTRTDGDENGVTTDRDFNPKSQF